MRTTGGKATMATAYAQDGLHGDGHGRSATGPSEIPGRGWKDILWRTYQEIGRDRVLLVAAGVTFYLLLAFVPALAALISLYGLFADPATIGEHVKQLSGAIPDGAMEIIDDQLKRLSAQGETTLGLTSAISLAVVLWSANAGVKALFEAMNVAYDEEEKRSFVKLNLLSLAFTLGTIASIILLLGTAVLLPVILEGLGVAGEFVIRIASIAALTLLLTVALAALYRWGPSRETAKWRWITPGAVLTIIVTIVASVLFSWYVSNFGSYNATYGSLGTVVGFMTWMWITMIILVCGAELNSEAEHQTARDSTTGPEQPLGTRGAQMADRVGKRYGQEDSRHQAQTEGGTNYGERGDDRAPVGHERQRDYDARTIGQARHDPWPAPRRPERPSLGKVALYLPVAIAVAWFGLRRRNT